MFDPRSTIEVPAVGRSATAEEDRLIRAVSPLGSDAVSARKHFRHDCSEHDCVCRDTGTTCVQGARSAGRARVVPSCEKRERDGGRTTLWFYRDAQQREVDFVLASGGARYLLEAKWIENPGPRDSLVLSAVAKLLRSKGQTPEVHTAIVCRTPHPSLVGDETRVIDLPLLGRLNGGA